jgi:hypothetical protein
MIEAETDRIGTVRTRTSALASRLPEVERLLPANLCRLSRRCKGPLRVVSGGSGDAQPTMRLGRPATLNLTHCPGGKAGAVPLRRGCRRAHGRPGRFAPRRRSALRASLTAAPLGGFGTLRSGRGSGCARKSWRVPTGESPVRVRGSARPVVSVARQSATAGVKRTQRVHGVQD